MHGTDRHLTSPVEGVHDHAAWRARRKVLQAAWRRLTGTVPGPGGWPASPVLRLAARPFPGGTEHRVAVGTPPLRLRVLVPAGAGAAPALLVPESHRAWAGAALRRGWAACLVSACDGADDTEAIAATQARRHDGGRIAWRAWALSRALDVLVGHPGVEAGRVFVAGHGRSGTAALLAAAFDERFAGAASSSSGVLGAADAPDLLALVAPRPLLVSAGLDDPGQSVWATEATVAAARQAYTLVGAPQALELRWRPGAGDLSTEGVEELVDRLCGGRRPPEADGEVPAARSLRQPQPVS